MGKYKEADLASLKTYSIRERKSTVAAASLGRPVQAGADFASFWQSLPDFLAAKDLRFLVQQVCAAVRAKKPVLLMMGAHVIKVGLTPVINDLMRSGVVSGIAMNGAGAIHDTELACFGATSEDVAEMLRDGRFGMAEETAAVLNGSAAEAAEKELGFGESLGKRHLKEAPQHADRSILATAASLGIPVTVHVALGTDIVHQHASADGAAIGAASMRDFRIWTHAVSGLDDGGVLLLFGSSVLLPEVFLKSLTVARNIYGRVENFTTANFDMIRHYRPEVNVVKRPVQGGGRGFSFTGHHEIMIPLFAAALTHELASA